MENLQAWYNEGYIITICWEYYSLSDILSKTGTHLQQVHVGIIIHSHIQYSKVYTTDNSISLFPWWWDHSSNSVRAWIGCKPTLTQQFFFVQKLYYCNFWWLECIAYIIIHDTSTHQWKAVAGWFFSTLTFLWNVLGRVRSLSWGEKRINHDRRVEWWMETTSKPAPPPPWGPLYCEVVISFIIKWFDCGSVVVVMHRVLFLKWTNHI